ncbi:dihydrodipicolinate synthase family protein [soil metagenome]
MTVHRGIFPIVPTAFSEAGELDMASQARAVDYLIDAGAHGLCILANYSEQFSLSDAERETLSMLILDHVAGRVPVIVTTSHYSSRIAAERSRRAQEAGAAMVMLMPPYHGASIRVGEQAIREAFARVADAIDIPIMVQDAPMAGTPLSAALLARLAREIPQVAYFKLENGVAADKLRALIALGGESIVGPFDGEESITLIPDLEAGATGTMPGGTTVDALRETWDLWHQGRRDEAVAAYERALPLIVYENKLCGLMATKVLMAEGGILASEQPRHPFAPLSAPVREGLLAMARRLDLLVLRWGR